MMLSKNMTPKPRFIWRRAADFLGHPSGCLLVLAATLTTLWVYCRIGNLEEVGFAEGYEVLKGSLCAQGGRLYGEIWNDQPPLHTWLLSMAFRLSNPSMTAARLVASGFGLLLFVSTFGLARRSGGPLAGWFACLTLLGAPEALRLSLAVMLEAAAMGMGLASVWAAFVWKQEGRERWLLFSGLLMGLALQIKFTAALFIPALLADLAVFTWNFSEGAPRIAVWFLARTLANWTAPLLAVFFAVASAFPGWSLDLLWFSHAAASARLPSSEGHAFHLGNLDGALPMICGASLLLVLPSLLRKWRELLFYYLLIPTLFLIHWFHRPYWPYYVLHFDLAFSLASGLGLAALAAALFRRERQASWHAGRTAAIAFGFSALLAYIGSETFFLAQDFLDHTAHAARIDEPGSLPETLASFRGPGRLFSTSPLAAFYARMPMIPDLAILPRKRFWSGQINYFSILARLKSAKPSRMILNPNYLAEPGWAQFLEERYELRGVAHGLLLYGVKTSPPPGKSPKSRPL
jgi:4-amino-4-deoxy-L-arabinose transferase-like glycosyltransferase